MISSQQQVPGPTAVGEAPAAVTNDDNYIVAWRNTDQSIWWIKIERRLLGLYGLPA
ncbi:MAG TPA: hypothetical protein VIX14_09635 [Terriglobales bacterium]